MHTEIGKRIRLVRGEESVMSFSKNLDIHRNTLPKYESGERSPDSEFITLLCKKYDISPTWLLLGKGPMRRSEQEAGLGGGYDELDDNLADIVSNWEKLPEKVRENFHAQVKELTKPRFIYADRVKKLKPHSQERVDFIWERGCKDVGIPGMYDKAAQCSIDRYLDKKITDTELYMAAVKWATDKLTVIRKVEKRNGTS